MNNKIKILKRRVELTFIESFILVCMDQIQYYYFGNLQYLLWEHHYANDEVYTIMFQTVSSSYILCMYLDSIALCI